MNENLFNKDAGFQLNQPSQDTLTDNQTQTGNYQEEDSENRDRNSQKEFPERTQQHDYKNPSANQIEIDEEDEVDTDGEIFNQDDKTNSESLHERSTDVNDLDPV